MLVFFYTSRYLTDKHFDIAWGFYPFGNPLNGSPENQLFEPLKLGCQYFFDIRRYLTDKHFDIV